MQGSKIDSLFKKGKSIITSGIDPIIEAKNNFDNPIFEVETLAEARALTCLGCDHFQKEPIDFLRVVDIRIPELSEMFCDDCGCELPYKLRQSISKCKLWER